MRTINDFIASGIQDIKPLLSLVLDKSSTELYTHSEYKLSTGQIIHLNKLINQINQGVPFAYLSGYQVFYHLNFKVTTDTLVPRPETELIVDIALDLLDKDKNYNILELGTGSGAIAVTIAHKRKNCTVVATDFSSKALEVAKFNANASGLSNISFCQGDWFAAVASQKFDLIISNPPYIAMNDEHLNNLQFEPKQALISGVDGLDDIKSIIGNAPSHLNKNGYLLLEHGYNQQDNIVQLLNNYCHINRFIDYNNVQRAILAQLN